MKGGGHTGLQQKQHNLRKAQARFDKVNKRTKQFQIEFVRSQNSRGRFRTKTHIVRGEKQFHGNNRGLFHKLANAKYRLKGDVPSVTRTLNAWKPKTFKGKVVKGTAKVTNFAVHDVAQTAVDTALAAETVGLKGADITQREVRNKLKQEYTRNAVDDYHRGVFFVGRTAVDAVKGTHNHFKQRKQAELEKAKYKLQKAEYKLFKVDSYKPKLKASKADIKAAKKLCKSKIVKSKNNIRRAMNLRRKQAYLQSKRELKFEQKQLKTDKKFKKKELRNQRKIKKNASAGLLVLKPVSYSAKRMKASAWQKAVNEDQDNDFVHAIDSAKRRVVEPTVQKVSKPQRLQREQKKRDALKDKETKSNHRLNKQENKLNQKHDSYKKRKKKPKPKSKKAKKSAKDTLSAALKAAYKFVKNVYEHEVKKFFASIAVPILIILLVFAFIIMVFSSIARSSSFTLGTYASQDDDLSEAEKYYTKLAYEMNKKILKVSSSENWKDGLAEFGANTGNFKDTPDTWVWGRSSEFDWDPVYDFDTYKLWSFLCAYYYNFDAAENGDIKYWKFQTVTKHLLENIFREEYEFKYLYDNTSHWEYRQEFNSKDFYSIEGAGTSGSYGYINISYPDALPFSGYNNDKTIYFDLSNGEVLNYNDDYSATGWYLKNQYVTDTDPDGNTYQGWFHNGETCGYGIWDNGTLVTPIPYVIPSENWCSFLQKYDWKTDCRLYYNVEQKKTFDQVIEDTLKVQSHSDERWQYYNLLVGNEEGRQFYGNHQTLYSLLPEPTIRDYSLKRQFGFEMTGWNESSDGIYDGIIVDVSSGTNLKMPFDGKIAEINTDENKITIRKDDVEYWYDGNGGTKRDTEVMITNAVIINSYSEGDNLTHGTEFCKTNADNVAFHIYIDTDGYGWSYVDPRLVLY